MRDWFEWNGVRSTDLGIRVTELPPITLPAERVSFVDVPGRAGSLAVAEDEDVYEDLLLTATCVVQNMERLDEVAAYLKGSGRVSFANREGGFYYARIVNQIPFETILRGNPHRRFAVNFRCKPFFYLDDSPTYTLTKMTFLTNPGAVRAEPVITVYGSGDITLIVGMTIVELTGVNGSITLDTPRMEAYCGNVSANMKVNGEYPMLGVGATAVSWTGNVSRVTVQPNWRTL